MRSATCFLDSRRSFFVVSYSSILSAMISRMMWLKSSLFTTYWIIGVSCSLVCACMLGFMVCMESAGTPARQSPRTVTKIPIHRAAVRIWCCKCSEKFWYMLPWGIDIHCVANECQSMLMFLVVYDAILRGLEYLLKECAGRSDVGGSCGNCQYMCHS